MRPPPLQHVHGRRAKPRTPQPPTLCNTRGQAGIAASSRPSQVTEIRPIKTLDQLHQYVVSGDEVGRMTSSSCPAKVQAGTSQPPRPPSLGVPSGAATRATPAWRIAPFIPPTQESTTHCPPLTGPGSGRRAPPGAPRWPSRRRPLRWPALRQGEPHPGDVRSATPSFPSRTPAVPSPPDRPAFRTLASGTCLAHA